MGAHVEKKKVLFICTGNSVRSQMAHALLKKFAGDKCDVYSAGITPAGVHRYTIRVMAEIGISMDGHESNHVNEYEHIPFDFIITLCEVAALSCPQYPGDGKKLNWFIEDPIRVMGDENRRMAAFQITRNILKTKVMQFIREYLQNPQNAL